LGGGKRESCFGHYTSQKHDRQNLISGEKNLLPLQSGKIITTWLKKLLGSGGRETDLQEAGKTITLKGRCSVKARGEARDWSLLQI